MDLQAIRYAAMVSAIAIDRSERLRADRPGLRAEPGTEIDVSADSAGHDSPFPAVCFGFARGTESVFFSCLAKPHALTAKASCSIDY